LAAETASAKPNAPIDAIRVVPKTRCKVEMKKLMVDSLDKFFSG
jgi:hypothetical protein